MFKAVLFDMDGVLVDSETVISEAAVIMFSRRYGVTVSHSDFIPYVGAGENRYIGGVAELYGLSIDIDEAKAVTYSIYRELALAGEAGMRKIEGSVDYIHDCKAAGLKVAVASAADRVKVLVNLEYLGLREEDFDAVLTGLDVERKKPFPDIYLEAARRVRFSPSSCLVAEDAVNGIRAGVAAGCRCLGITSSFPRETLRDAGALWCAADLASAPRPWELTD